MRDQNKANSEKTHPVAETIADKVADVFSLFTGIAVIGMMVMVVADVLMRLIINRVIPGTTELAQVLLLFMVAAFPRVILNNGNTMVTVFTANLPRAARRVLNAVTVSGAAAICGLIAWQMFRSTQYSYSFKITYTLSRFPEWTAYFVFGLSMTVAALCCLLIIWREWRAEAPQAKKEAALADGKGVLQ